MELNSKQSDKRQSTRRDHPFKVFQSISSPKVISNITITNTAVGNLCEIIADNFTNISAKARGITSTYLVNEESGDLLLDRQTINLWQYLQAQKCPKSLFLSSIDLINLSFIRLLL